MKLLSNPNHFVTGFEVLYTAFASTEIFKNILLQVFMEKCVFSVEQMQLHQEYFHACQDIPFSFPVFYPALFTSFFYAMAGAGWRSLCFLQQDSKPPSGPETVEVLRRSLRVHQVSLFQQKQVPT